MIRAALALSLLASPALADDAPRVLARAKVESAGPLQIGQSTRLVVDVLTSTFFTAGAEIPPLEVEHAVVMAAPEPAQNFTERIDGVPYSGMRHGWIIVPLAEGELRVPALAIVLHPGPAAWPTTASTEAIVVSVSGDARPENARDAVVTSHLEVRQTLEPEPKDLAVGGAVTRRIEIDADGTPAMLLPPLPPAQVSGLAAYPKAADVEDRPDPRAGALVGTRTEITTYVVQESGRYELPAVDVRWWDPRAGALHTATAPALHFEAKRAASAAVFAPPDAAPELDLRAIWPLLLVAGALGAGIYARRPIADGLARLRQRREALRRQRAASEAAAYDSLRASLRGDPSAVPAKLYRWLDRAEARAPATLSAVHELDAASARLEEHYAARAQALDAEFARALGDALPRARHRLRARPARERAGELGPLNPD